MNDNQQQPPMNGNDDLAKTLNEGLQFEETPKSGTYKDADLKLPSLTMPADDSQTPDPVSHDDVPTMSSTPPSDDDARDEYQADTADADDKQDDQSDDTSTTSLTTNDAAGDTSGGGQLDDLKASALDALRPLVGKLKLPAEERFDTLLLIIRSTDDQSLLQQAHDAAKEITDDTRRAQALLDVIKEIDYFSNKR